MVEPAHSTASTPPGWPSKVRPISIDGLGHIGVHEETQELFWDGKPIAVRKRLDTVERLIGWAVAGSGILIAVLELGRSCGWWGG